VARVGELDVKRQRGVEVCERLEDERDAVVSLTREGTKFGFGHGASTILPTRAGAVARLRGASLQARDAGARTISGASGASRSRASAAWPQRGCEEKVAIHGINVADALDNRL
jgi:hypothetical protein